MANTKLLNYILSWVTLKITLIFSIATMWLQIWQKSQGTWGMTGAGTKQKITSNTGGRGGGARGKLITLNKWKMTKFNSIWLG